MGKYGPVFRRGDPMWSPAVRRCHVTQVCPSRHQQTPHPLPRPPGRPRRVAPTKPPGAVADHACRSCLCPSHTPLQFPRTDAKSPLHHPPDPALSRGWDRAVLPDSAHKNRPCHAVHPDRCTALAERRGSQRRRGIRVERRGPPRAGPARRPGGGDMVGIRGLMACPHTGRPAQRLSLHRMTNGWAGDRAFDDDSALRGKASTWTNTP
jgi:hypothetical protein